MELKGVLLRWKKPHYRGGAQYLLVPLWIAAMPTAAVSQHPQQLDLVFVENGSTPGH